MSLIRTPFDRTPTVGTADRLRLLAILAVHAVEPCTRSAARADFVCSARSTVQLTVSGAVDETISGERLAYIEACAMENVFGARRGQVPTYALEVFRSLHTATITAVFYGSVHAAYQPAGARRVLDQLEYGEREALVSAACVLMTPEERRALGVDAFTPVIVDVSTRAHALIEHGILALLRSHASVPELELHFTPSGVFTLVTPR